jgi:hypothetical protein
MSKTTEPSPWPNRTTGADRITQAKSDIVEVLKPVAREVKKLFGK